MFEVNTMETCCYAFSVFFVLLSYFEIKFMYVWISHWSPFHTKTPQKAFENWVFWKHFVSSVDRWKQRLLKVVTLKASHAICSSLETVKLVAGAQIYLCAILGPCWFNNTCAIYCGLVKQYKNATCSLGEMFLLCFCGDENRNIENVVV